VRLLLVSDQHYRLRQFDWLLTRAPAVDAVVLAGDLLDIRSAVALDVQALAVTAALRDLAHHTTLFAASGNHDLDSRAEGEKVARWMRPLARNGVHVDYTSVALGDDLGTVGRGRPHREARVEVDLDTSLAVWTSATDRAEIELSRR